MLLVDEHGAPFEVEDLDAAGVLEAARMSERQIRRAELGKLELAAQWCVLHPPTLESGYAAWTDEEYADAPGPDTLGGDGTPGVAAFTAEPLAAALGTSTAAAMSLLGDVLDLQHRLPRLWEGVRDLAVASWKARRVATQTRHLPLNAARWIDEQLAGRLDRIGPVTIDRLVTESIAEFDLEELRRKEQAEQDTWGVRLHHGHPLTGFAGTSRIEITGDTMDLDRFHHLVADHAETLGRLGDTDPFETRKAKAIGIIAGDPTLLDHLLDQHAAAPSGADNSGDGAHEPVTSVTRRRRSVLYLHFTPENWLTRETCPDHGTHRPTPDETIDGVGIAEGFGPATLDKIRDWLDGTQVRIQPVLDLARTEGVDAHDPPAWMAETVRLRDPHCVFPHCHRDSRRCDLDHITPYDSTGPPGQTTPATLAPLCRRHHRAKTFGRWRYQRLTDGSYHWHSPNGNVYAVLPEGTLTL